MEAEFIEQEKKRLRSEYLKAHPEPVGEQPRVDLPKLESMIKNVVEQAEQVKSMPIIDTRLIVDVIREIAAQYSLALKETVESVRRIEASKKFEDFNNNLNALQQIIGDISDFRGVVDVLRDISVKLDKLTVNADLEQTMLMKLNAEIDTW
jgi:hypothetical protein